MIIMINKHTYMRIHNTYYVYVRVYVCRCISNTYTYIQVLKLKNI